VGLKLNIRKDAMESILKVLPAEKSPTVSPLADSDYMAIEVIIDEKTSDLWSPRFQASRGIQA